MGCITSNDKDMKNIVVTGATGQQGGALINSILQNYSHLCSVTAVTRNVGSEKAKALIKMGVIVVQADYDDLESLKTAFQNAYGVFCVTNFWETFDAEKEKKQAHNLAQACAHNKVKHVIWSTLEQTKEILKGKAPVIHGKIIFYFTFHFLIII